jgi:DNA (cytosine-5)-methyltransferase 1
MQEKIMLLDLCCKAGGCSVGYYQGAIEMGLDIEIVGVDIEDQPNYPFTFIQDDAVEFLTKGKGKGFTHIHASPPCQKYSVSTSFERSKGKVYRDNLDELKQLMKVTGLPGVIENVPNSPIRPDIVLRGDMFGLKVLRKRHFELVNWWTLGPQIPKKIGSVVDGDFVIVYGKCGIKKSSGKTVSPKFRKATMKETWKYAMGIDWMKRDEELAEAIPPAYTKYISKEFFNIRKATQNSIYQ